VFLGIWGNGIADKICFVGSFVGSFMKYSYIS